jgi:D-glycero-alpha-D-manno-heptose 1-phosphate guanylyltransferase
VKAIILVGGLGTRLRSVLRDLPKPMAPIRDKPFLAYLLHYLQKQGITQIVFPVHYLSEKIKEYFQSHYAGIDIQYVEEAQPLGTGGAMVNALSVLREVKEPVFVLNGDTFAKLDYQAMLDQHQKQHATLTMALRHVSDGDRYGKVITENNRIITFKEKGESGPGLINAGVYLINPDLFSRFSLPPQFSFERDFMLPHLIKLNPQAFIVDDYFIDIGIPEDYSRAIKD